MELPADRVRGFGFRECNPRAFRVAFVAMNVFLILDGHEIDASEPEVATKMLDLANGTLDEARLTGFGLPGCRCPYRPGPISSTCMRMRAASWASGQGCAPGLPNVYVR